MGYNLLYHIECFVFFVGGIYEKNFYADLFVASSFFDRRKLD